MTTYLMKFTEPELEVIYEAVSNLSSDDIQRIGHEADAAADSVIDKVTANKIGPDAHFSGAIGVLYDESA
jgi:hypothetical protein